MKLNIFKHSVTPASPLFLSPFFPTSLCCFCYILEVLFILDFKMKSDKLYLVKPKKKKKGRGCLAMNYFYFFPELNSGNTFGHKIPESSRIQLELQVEFQNFQEFDN